MKNIISSVAAISVIYTVLIFLIAWYAHHRKETGRSIISNPVVYSLSLGVYCTSWTFFGSVGKAATTGIDFLLIYLGPSLTAFSWLFLLRRIIKISKEHNITSIADFLSQRYGKSPWLGALVTIIAFLGIMPYIALQLKAVSTSFFLLSGVEKGPIEFVKLGSTTTIPIALLLALILALFSIIFGARRLVSSERHEGLIAAVAFESIVKLVALLAVGVFVTYGLFDGFIDIFDRLRVINPEKFSQLFTFNTSKSDPNYISTFTLLFLSMGAVMLLPRQFHVMVIENSDERHISTAMWLFPAYLFLINLFVMPIAIGGILTTGGSSGADYFVLSLPQLSGHRSIALLAFLGGFSAAAGMVMVESIAISTMLLNHIFMPVIVRLTPRTWFPVLLINLKRFGIVLVVLLGYFYYRMIGDSYTLVNMGLISFSAATQFMPAMLGGLYWNRGNKAGAISGILFGFLVWLYTLLLPTFSKSGWIPESVLTNGPFGITLLKPTELFGLTGMDLWSHSLFWSMLFNISSYIICSILLTQNEQERDQVHKFIGVFSRDEAQRRTERKRLSKPMTTDQLVTLMSKFIGEAEARKSLELYSKGRDITGNGSVSEFELPDLKRFTEKTLAGSVGGAAARAIVNNFLSDIGSSMEPVYDIFSDVRTNLDQNRESLFVRLKASEIITRTLDLQVIMDDLLRLLVMEFKFDIALIITKNDAGTFSVSSIQGENIQAINMPHWYLENVPILYLVYHDKKAHFINDLRLDHAVATLGQTSAEGFISCAHIPIYREGEPVIAVLSLFSKSIAGLFTKEFIELLSSLAGQLAQAITIVQEIEAKQRERSQKEAALLQTARITRDMEIAQQIQKSFLPDSAPVIAGIDIAGRCISAAHVGGDYYDFFLRSDQIIDIVIADVSGHSVGAALVMSEVRTLLKSEANSVRSPSSILETLNNQLYDDLTRAELFITMFYAKYDSETGVLSYSNAGHNHPILQRTHEPLSLELDTEGLIVGVEKDVFFEECSVKLSTGDILFFYTDGLTEACNSEGDMFDTAGVYNHLKVCMQLSADEILDSFYAKIHDFTGIQNLQDDISMVVVKIL
ncbi:MAG: SpoIIE family protein phosphatase [Desulfuromonadaceae bacterium]|nr:SpoIIE family protein phosphatase [Desulfuromonadaceae bacterium]